MPGVGRFRRTDVQELTLTEIHASNEPNALGITVWNRLDWIILLAAQIGWVVVTDRVQKADEEEVSADQDEPPTHHLGAVYACDCGMIYSLLGPLSLHALSDLYTLYWGQIQINCVSRLMMQGIVSILTVTSLCLIPMQVFSTVLMIEP